MRAIQWMAGIASVLPALASLPAMAQVRDLAVQGYWKAYGGFADNGRRLCGVSAQGGGRWLGMKYFDGDAHLTVHMTSNRWTVVDGDRIAVQMQFDDHTAWTASAKAFHVSNGDGALEITIPTRSLDDWLDEFKSSYWLYVRFPNDNVTDWKADLEGSNRIMGPFAGCLGAILASR